MSKNDLLLTDVELELMNILWKIEKGSVHDVLDHLPKDRPLAYTSVSTILRILEKKNILKTQKDGRTHLYIPLLKKKDYEIRFLDQTVKNVFDGAPTGLVHCLVNNKLIKKDELKELKNLIDSLL